MPQWQVDALIFIPKMGATGYSATEHIERVAIPDAADRDDAIRQATASRCLRESTRHTSLIRCCGVELPAPWDALQFVCSAIFKLEA
jgi:hypothetical protein